MKRLCLYVIGLYLMILFPGEQSAFSENSSQQEKVVRYAFTSFFADADLSFAQGALDLWGKKIGQRAGFDSKCFMFDTIDILSEKIRNNEIDIASTSSVDYIRLKKTLDIELLYTRIKNGKLKDSYYVLGRKDANISTISQLKGKRIILNKSDILGKYYLNTLLLKEFQKEIPDIFSSIDYQEKSSQNLYSLFFGKADVCVVFKNTFDLLCDLNPQIKESVNILSISQPFISFVTFFRRPLDEKISTMFKNAVNSMLDYEEGRQMMMLFNIEGIQTISDEDVANVANLLNEYELLKK